MATLEAALQHVLNLAEEYSLTLKENEEGTAPAGKKCDAMYSSY